MVPPAGYSFLRLGYLDLATRCKEISKERGLDVRIVSVSPLRDIEIHSSSRTGTSNNVK